MSRCITVSNVYLKVLGTVGVILMIELELLEYGDGVDNYTIVEKSGIECASCINEEVCVCS